MNPTVAIIIPYFQRQPGLLRTALESVTAQEVTADVRIVIIDDSSPVPAADEVAGLAAPSLARIEIRRQPNAGPAAARNAGLVVVAGTVEYVAFLDSDDRWESSHLDRALAALETGHDLYFANIRDVGETKDKFSSRWPDARRHPQIPGLRNIHQYEGDLTSQLVERCPVETSTVVFRQRIVPNLRFPTEFRNAYEDMFFWLSIAARTRRVAFSTEVEAHYGSGVNVFRDSGWGSEHRLRRIVDQTFFRARAGSMLELSPEQTAHLKSRIAPLREEFTSEILHRLRRRQGIPWELVGRQLRADPATAASFLPIALRGIAQRMLRRPRGL